MLEDALFESQKPKETRKPATLFVSVVVHVVILVVLALIPLVQTQAIPAPAVDMSLWAPKPEPLKSIDVFTSVTRIRTRIQVDPNAVIAPQSIPTQIAYVVEAPADRSAGFVTSGTENGVASLLRDFISRQPEVEAPPTPPPPPPAPVRSELIRIGGTVQEANLIHQVNPIYPPLARQTRVQGVVLLEAVISKEGTIESLRLLNGHPLLNQAALDAVQQWRYRPTHLNGEPVEVITTITVRFTLQ